MLTLLSECHFWTTREDVRIKHTDFGAFRYTRNRELQHMPVDYCAEAKRDYTERRNGLTVLKNSRKSRMGRLKDNLKRLEELMRSFKVVHIHWTDGSQVLLLFANGIIAHISIDMFTGDISRMVYEKYLVGKLAADTITDGKFFFCFYCILMCLSILCRQFCIVNRQRIYIVHVDIKFSKNCNGN